MEPHTASAFLDTSVKARRTRHTVHPKHEAKAFRDEYQLFLNGNGPRPGTAVEGRKSRKPARPWNKATAAWIESGATRSSTRNRYRTLLRQFGEKPSNGYVEEFTEETVSRFFSSLRRKGRSLATCAACLRTLAALFSWARPNESPTSSSLISQWAPYKDRRCEPPHFYSPEEFQRLLQACDSIAIRRHGQRSPQWWQYFISVLYHAGLRINEAAHLIWRDVDLDTNVLRIQPHVRFKWRPKGKAHRSVPLPASVIDRLIQLQQEQSEGVPYAFLTFERYQESCSNGPKDEILCGIGKSFKRIREMAGIVEGTIRDLRRTCITNLAKHPQI